MSAIIIISVEIPDLNHRRFYDKYLEKIQPVIQEFGGQILIRSERITMYNNVAPPDRMVIIAFPSREHLDACFESEEYNAVNPLKDRFVQSNTVIIED